MKQGSIGFPLSPLLGFFSLSLSFCLFGAVPRQNFLNLTSGRNKRSQVLPLRQRLASRALGVGGFGKSCFLQGASVASDRKRRKKLGCIDRRS